MCLTRLFLGVVDALSFLRNTKPDYYIKLGRDSGVLYWKCLCSLYIVGISEISLRKLRSVLFSVSTSNYKHFETLAG